MTHSLEVAEIATRIARKLNCKYAYFKKNKINLDLVNCAALLHDIGHPPFGHSGEMVLNKKMEGHGGFEGNAQTFRIITRLENRLGRGSAIDEVIRNPNGLNLTVGTLASVIKYDNVLGSVLKENPEKNSIKGYYESEVEVVEKIRNHLDARGRDIKTIECQIMDLADDIAYSTYDLEDTLEAGIMTPFDMMSIDDEMLEKITFEVDGHVKKRIADIEINPSTVLSQLSGVFGVLLTFADGDDSYRVMDEEKYDRWVFVARSYSESLLHARNPLVRRQYLETLIEQHIDSLYVEFDREAPHFSKLMIAPGRLIAIESMKALNYHKVIRSRRFKVHEHRTTQIIEAIFDALANDAEGRLLSDFQREQRIRCGNDEKKRMRLVCDIVSSLTDVEALRFYDQLHSSQIMPIVSYLR